ncbi:MAG: IS66-like element accessory protein TnpA [Burkholderiales bacterium]
MTSDRSASGAGSRRRYSAEVQAQVLAECGAPGASVAKVAMSHGINSNVVHRWRQLAREGRGAPATIPGEFVPVSLPAASPPVTARDIQIQLRRGATTMTITWPLSAAADFGAWMRELLR